MDAELQEVARLVPVGLEWSTGTGTKSSHAQILPEVHVTGKRRHSFFAVAATEAEALRQAAKEAREYLGYPS